MMKYWILPAVVCASCLMAAGELSEDQLEDAEDLVKMTAVRDRTEKSRVGEYEVLEIDFLSKLSGLGDIYVRIAVEVTDREKNSYLVKKEERYRDNYGVDYLGTGNWELRIPYGSFRKIKISGYAVEFGLMDGDKFVPFDADYDDVDTYEELTARTTNSFPEKCEFLYWVETDR